MFKKIEVKKSLRRHDRCYIHLLNKYIRSGAPDHEYEIEQLILQYQTLSGYLKNELLRKELIGQLKRDREIHC